MQTAPEPKTLLGHYKVLSPHAGVRVSPLCLGAMNFGTKWSEMLGECSKEEAFKIMDTFYEAGGNFIDTANNYQGGESEQWIGEWMESRKNRSEIVLATKYSSTIDPNGHIFINHAGNHKKSLRTSVDRSLQNLRTDYIDVLYIHWWDYTTSIPEIMQALNALVVSGKVLYLGISDTPAWIVSAANTYAQTHNLAQFVVYQGKWNFEERDFERDIIPMAKQFGLSLAPWSVMGGGRYKKDEKAARAGTPFHQVDKDHEAIMKGLDEVAASVGATRQQIAIAYVIKKYPRTFPILGGRKATHLQDNIKALSFVDKLTDEVVAKLEGLKELDIGFPHTMVGTGDYSKNWILSNSGKIQNLSP
ncbi:hypothetical protein HK097_002002 [Rhizophlyctis rosea]|uniref:NADP-dependent oxidoreductase domain-containing protein n=1 Tax=Rhizophlyctis rosea TaxID=64517 RepID=A0AAD5X0G2_9FUNG|nr:hypothetical protein HK097_002002 [Rhizophlyctis rosea]